MPAGEKVSMRAHLLDIEKRKRVKQPELEGPNPCPPALRHLYDYFLKLAATRDRTFGMSPLNYREIQAWSELMQVSLDPFEVDVLRDLDNAYLAVHAGSKEAGKEIPEAGKQPDSSKEVQEGTIRKRRR